MYRNFQNSLAASQSAERLKRTKCKQAFKNEETNNGEMAQEQINHTKNSRKKPHCLSTDQSSLLEYLNNVDHVAITWISVLIHSRKCPSDQDGEKALRVGVSSVRETCVRRTCHIVGSVSRRLSDASSHSCWSRLCW